MFVCVTYFSSYRSTTGLLSTKSEVRDELSNLAIRMRCCEQSLPHIYLDIQGAASPEGLTRSQILTHKQLGLYKILFYV